MNDIEQIISPKQEYHASPQLKQKVMQAVAKSHKTTGKPILWWSVAAAVAAIIVAVGVKWTARGVLTPEERGSKPIAQSESQDAELRVGTSETNAMAEEQIAKMSVVETIEKRQTASAPAVKTQEENPTAETSVDATDKDTELLAEIMAIQSQIYVPQAVANAAYFGYTAEQQIALINHHRQQHTDE